MVLEMVEKLLLITLILLLFGIIGLSFPLIIVSIERVEAGWLLYWWSEGVSSLGRGRQEGQQVPRDGAAGAHRWLHHHIQEIYFHISSSSPPAQYTHIYIYDFISKLRQTRDGGKKWII